MSPSDYERKPSTAEKSRHVMLEESWGEDKHKNWTLASALRLRPTTAKPVWGRVGGRRGMGGELVKHFEQWQKLNKRPRQTATGVFYYQETASQLSRGAQQDHRSVLTP